MLTYVSSFVSLPPNLHTKTNKNNADKRFNNMKNEYHVKNLFTFQEIIDACGNSPYVQAIPVDHKDFFNYDKLLNTMYKKFPAGGVLKYQLFTCEESGATMKVLCRSSALDDAVEEIVVMRKGCSNKTINVSDSITIDGKKGARSDYVQSAKPERLYDSAPGLKPRKQVEMYTKWRPLLPEDKKDITCPRPSDQVFAAVKAEIVESRERRQKVKERNATLSLPTPTSKRKGANTAASTKRNKKV